VSRFGLVLFVLTVSYFGFTQATVEMKNERYIVQPGDYLSLISQKTGVDMDILIQLNNISEPDAIEVGQVLILPSNTSGQGGASQVGNIVPSSGIPRPVNQNIHDAMNGLLELNDFPLCQGDTQFFVGDVPDLTIGFLDSLKQNGYIYTPIFQIGNNPAETVTLARVTGNGVNVYSMMAITEGTSLMLCNAN
jgi:LysM repeat protein